MMGLDSRKIAPPLRSAILMYAIVGEKRLGGRAWIAGDSGEVMHMELSLTDEIPQAKVRHWYLSINYAPVQFHHNDIRMRLPQTVDAYWDFEDHRTIVYHTFSDFMLFSVQTGKATENPTNP